MTIAVDWDVKQQNKQTKIKPKYRTLVLLCKQMQKQGNSVPGFFLLDMIVLHFGSNDSRYYVIFTFSKQLAFNKS